MENRIGQDNEESLFQQVSFFTPLLPEISEYVPDLTRSDRWSIYKGTCPKCKADKLLVEITKRAFYCSNCFRNGDVIVFTGMIMDMSPRDTMNHLIKKYNLKVDNGTNITQ